MTVTGQFDQVLAFCTAARWFGDKGRDPRLVGLPTSAWLSEPDSFPAVRIGYAQCVFDDELPEIGLSARAESTYQLPLSYYPKPIENLQHAFVGSWPEPDLDDVRVWAYDAMQDKEATRYWLQALLDGRTVDGLEFSAVAADELGGHRAGNLRSLVMPAEQSNTSVLFGDVAMLKMFRRLEAGHNPGVEIESALTGLDSKNVPHVLGRVSGSWPTQSRGGDHDRVHGDLGLLSVYQRSSTEGWAYATSSVRDLYAEGDLRADEVGGDFAAESHRLGVTTAQVHRELVEAFGSTVWGPAELNRLAEQMIARLDSVVLAVPELMTLAQRLHAVFSSVADYSGELVVQRIHGDFHLGQALRGIDGWKLIDFEGEPAKPIAQRARPDSALRDVAGMLRSFDYVARSLQVDHPGEPQIEYRAEEWVRRNSEAFLDGYVAGGGQDPRAEAGLLDAFVADKLIYEVMYESRNRPGWLSIPLAAAAKLSR